MSDKHFVGLDLTGFSDNGLQKPISRVTLFLDDENVLTAGDDTGFELTAPCPHATQAMVNSMLAQLKGYQYHMIQADDANLDPAAELGDGVTAGPVYTTISRIAEDGDGYAGVQAPGEAEMEEEYPSAGPMSQEFNRKIAQTRSSITKTAEEIRLEVTNEVAGLNSRITQTASSLDSKIENTAEGLQSQITQNYSSLNAKISSTDGRVASLRLDLNGLETQVTGIDGNVSTLSQTVKGIQADVRDVESGLSQTVRIAADGVTVTNASGSKLTIDGGQINADTLNLTGKITFSDLDSGAQSTINGAASDAADALSAANTAQQDANDANSTISGWSYRGGTYIDGAMIKAGTVMASKLIGGEVLMLTEDEAEAGGITISDASTADYAIDFYSNGAMRVQAYGRYATLYLEAGRGSNTGAIALTDIGGKYVASFNCTLIPMGTNNLEHLGDPNNTWEAAYIQDLYADNMDNTSDREKKTDIGYDLAAYDALFDRLKPAEYRYKNGTSGRVHLGLIAQDVEQAMTDTGLEGAQFAGLVIGDLEARKNYFLRYNEIFTLCIRQIQTLKARVAALEGSMNP